MIPHRYNPVRGFTLIELIISVALFAIVMVIVSAAYLNLINLDARTRAENDLVNNLAFVLDTMAREIRTGTHYQCVSTGGDGQCSQFSFVDSNNCSITFTISGGTITQTGGDGSGSACMTTTTSLLDSRVTMSSNSVFYVSGNTNYLQPQVAITLSGTYTPNPQVGPVSFTMETMATERGLDVP